MFNFESLGKMFLAIGALFLVLGLLFSYIKHIPFLGKMPGDILIEKKNFMFYFPLATSLILSVVLSILFYFFSKK
ncbi:DUF2905 domain-containing protein [bacterium]|nr:DUF2905 domain-containing protein [bacterium]